jgi:hypothetical protein
MPMMSLVAFVYGQVDLAPGAALADPVLTHLPFAFAEDLQTGRIDHHVRRPLRGRRGIFTESSPARRDMWVWSGTGRSR